jgi:hypothetical protein
LGLLKLLGFVLILSKLSSTAGSDSEQLVLRIIKNAISIFKKIHPFLWVGFWFFLPAFIEKTCFPS